MQIISAAKAVSAAQRVGHSASTETKLGTRTFVSFQRTMRDSTKKK